LTLLYFFAKEIISNVDSITKIAESAGIFGPIVLALLICLGILFSPIPSFVLTIAAEFLYNTWWGALYSYIGHILAAIVPFAATRAFKINKEYSKSKKYKDLIKKTRIFYTYSSVFQ
jgi:uncharacterized membrane protein YdjX (TVP38/TMEM64 family)